MVEQAFGREKGHFRILTNNSFWDPDFAANVAIVCAALHNVCEKWCRPFEELWLLDKTKYNDYHPPAGNAYNNNHADAPGVLLRNNLAHYLQAALPVHHWLSKRIAY